MWWSGLLVGIVLGVTTKLIQPAGTVTTATGQGPVLALAAASGLLLVASTLCLRLLVSRIGERQDARAAFVLERGAELDADEARVSAGPAEKPLSIEPEMPILLVQPSSRDAVYGKY